MASIPQPINPTGDPSYLGLSKPISQPDADKSMASLFEGAGNLFKAGVTGAEAVVTNWIDEEIRTETDRERGALTTSLEMVSGRRDPSQSDLLGPGGDVPSDIRDVERYVENLKAVSEGKPNLKTYYFSNLLRVATSLRNRYPGYRDYIDKKISEITGVNPANAYITALVSEVQAGMKKTGDIRPKLMSALIDEAERGNPEAKAMLDSYQANLKTDSDVVGFLAKSNEYKFREAREKAEAGRGDRNRDDASVNATQRIERSMSQGINQYIDAIRIGTGTDTTEGVRDFLLRYGQGGQRPSTEQLAFISSRIDAQKAAFTTAMRAKFSQIGADGKSETMRVKGGSEEVNKMIAASASQFDDIKNAIMRGDTSIALATANALKGRIADETYGLSTGRYGSQVTRLKALSEVAPRVAETLANRYLLDGKTGLEFQTYLLDRRAGVLTGETDPQTGQTPTIGSMIDHVQDRVGAGVRDGARMPSSLPLVYSDFVDWHKDILNKDLDVKARYSMAKAFFSDPTLLSRFNTDGVITDSQGRQRAVPGKNAVFLKLTSPEMVEAVKEIARERPDIWTAYTNWAQQSAGVQLLRQDAQDLSKASLRPGMKILWDTDNNRYDVKVPGYPNFLNTPLRRRDTAFSARFGDNAGAPYDQELAEIQRTTNRVNMMLSGYENIAKATGQDVRAFLYEQLRAQGVRDPSTMGSERIGLIGWFMNALTSGPKTTVPRAKGFE